MLSSYSTDYLNKVSLTILRRIQTDQDLFNLRLRNNYLYKHSNDFQFVANFGLRGLSYNTFYSIFVQQISNLIHVLSHLLGPL